MSFPESSIGFPLFYNAVDFQDQAASAVSASVTQ